MSTPAVNSSPFLTALPGSIATPARSPLYVDGIPAATVALPAARGQQAPDGQRFWSSEPRSYGDQANEMMIVTLNSARLINYVALDLPHFPSQYSLAWRDTKGTWHWVAGPNGPVLQFIIAGSVPAVVDSAAALTAGLNPYHYGAGHWIHYYEPVKPFTAGAIMVVGTRALQTVINVNPGKLPVNASGRACPYPLGVRNLDFGYQVLSQADVPYTLRSPSCPTERQPFAGADDICGSPVTLTMRENRASDLLNGLPWKCAPQPVSSAVVNLYADVRDSTGTSQVIDRFYVDPTTSGVSLNLYYATAVPASGFQAVDTPLGAAYVTTSGSVAPVPDPEGLVFSGSRGWLDLAAEGAGADFTQPWWMGWEVQPQFAATDGGSYLICDAGFMQIWYGNGTWYFDLPGGASPLASFPALHAVNDRIRFAAGWDGSNLHCWLGQNQNLPGFSMTACTTPFSTAKIRFGASQTAGFGTAWNGNYRLTSFICKQEAPLIDPVNGGCPEQFTAWGAGPQAFTAPPAGPGPTTENACCRFDVSFVLGPPLSLSPYGFVGGLGTAWAAAVWTPVQLSFKLTAGFVQFPPVTAVAFKFEFTDLAPEPYEFYTQTPQTCNIFPAAGAASPASQPPLAAPTASATTASLTSANSATGQVYPASADTGMIVNQQAAPQNFYSDSPPARVPPAQGAALPTEALYGTDPHAAEAMQQSGGSLYNFQPWKSSPQGAPRQVVTGQQSYQQATFTQASRVGYFVGLSQLTMYRVDYTAASDTAEYIDTFGDTAGLDPVSLANTTTGTTIPWTWAPNLLTVPVNLPPGSVAQLNSPVYYSMHQVTGVQFASVQSAPFQLLPDPGFLNPALPYVTSVGDALPLTVSPAASSPIGALVTVSREAGQITWTAMMASYGLWSGFAGPTLSWAQLQGTSNPATASYGGIAYTGAPVPVSAAGVVWIAARVFAPQPLNAPLFLQLLDGATGAVVAEEPVSVVGGSVTEWFAGYVLGQSQQPSTLSWGQAAGTYPLWSSTSGQTWGSLDTFQPPLGATLSWQLVQYGLTNDVWGVDDVSIFEDSIVWQFSNDGGGTWWSAYGINANPSGALVFPPPAPGKGYQLQWRVLGYRPGLTVSSLAIRPWYSCYPRGVPPRIPGLPHGPNVSHLDHYGPITQDVYWQAWSDPIPQSWYYTYQQLLQQNTTYVQPPPSPLPAGTEVLGAGLVVPLAAIVYGPETFSDIYSSIYTYYYGVPDGGDIYTDNFGNGEYQSDLGPTD
jgi:hypothetical protein